MRRLLKSGILEPIIKRPQWIGQNLLERVHMAAERKLGGRTSSRRSEESYQPWLNKREADDKEDSASMRRLEKEQG